MLEEEQNQYVYARAYVPEHLPEYVHAISGLNPFLVSDYLCYHGGGHLLFIGYPLIQQTASLENAYQKAMDRFQPDTVAIIAPEIWLSPGQYHETSPDKYYKLNLPISTPNPKVAYMCRRAARELRVGRVDFGRPHLKLLKQFVSEREWTGHRKRLFDKIPAYMKTCRQAVLLEAKKGKHLIAYTIVDLGAVDYAFYMFNIRSKDHHVPGASDLLFQEMVNMASENKKRVLNLGLGVNSGVRRFKEKWGAQAFWPYRSVLVRPQGDSRSRTLKALEVFLASANRNMRDEH